MLAFLIGTSILNIFLGYALAVYLMRESLTLENHRSAGDEIKLGASFGRPAERSELYPPQVTATPAAGQLTGQSTPPSSAQTVGQNGNSADQAPSSATSFSGDDAPLTDDAVNRGPEEMDQQLLAGIADFRSQLAKLRAETGSEEPKRRQVARTK